MIQLLTGCIVASCAADSGARSAPPDAGSIADDRLSDAGLDIGTTDASASTPADAAIAADAGAVGGPVVEPGVWTFVDVAGMRCADGSSTGIGMRIEPGAEALMVYFLGGGACWNAATCNVGAAQHLNGYGRDDLEADDLGAWSMFQSDEPRNPFHGMSYVVVPYCTGDVHAGTRAARYGRREVLHHGALNVRAMLPVIADRFEGARRIIVVGTSAGGFGAQLNYPQIAAAFPDVDVELIADGSQLVNPTGGLVSEWVSTWGIEIPDDCTGCTENFPLYLDYLFTRYPDARFGLIASMRDSTLTPFFNYGVDTEAFRDATSDVLDLYDRAPRGAYFVRSGLRHGYLNKVSNLERRANAATFEWVRRFVGGEIVRERP